MTTACPKVQQFWQRFWLPISIVVILLTAFIILFFQIRRLYQRFSTQTTLDYSEIIALWQQAQTTPVKSEHGRTNFLLLGTDTLEYRIQDYPITDTMILGSLDLSSGAVNLLPLPRDIYLPDLGYKINMIYPVAYQASPEGALQVTTDQVAAIFDLPIHYSAVVNLTDLQDFIQLLGGVDVTIERAFTDTKFPRADVDITTVTDPALLYETVSFATGEAHLDGVTALQFIRSRHGDNGEGNDYARSARQEKVLAALAHQVLAKLIAQLKQLDFSFLGQLYNFYQTRYEQQIPFVQLLALGRDYLAAGQPLTITSHSLEISPGSPTANLRETEASRTNGNQWSLTILNRPALVQEVQQKLNLL